MAHTDTPLDLDRLESLAKAATGLGEWTIIPGVYAPNASEFPRGPEIVDEIGSIAAFPIAAEANCAYLREANPATILKLCAAAREMEGVIRAIELRVDALNTKGYQQQKNTQAALDAIKGHCRAALREAGK